MTQKLIFSPETGVLSTDEKQITLTEQGRRCLVYFCLNEGQLISRETFTRDCWGSRGIIVSDATVRQTVFRLRRSLGELGVNDDILQTRGKAGYLLRPGVIILEQAGQEETVIEEETAEQRSPENLQPVLNKKATRSVIIPHINWRRASMLLGIILICGSVGFYYRFSGLITPIKYSVMREDKGRNFFVASWVNNKEVNSVIDRTSYWLARENLPTSDSRYIYINGVLNAYVFTMYCNAPIDDEGAKCRSLTILGKLHS
ncbi:hypothetical protein GJV06_19225 [Enterobacteriaceae bacterium RIT691]|nr:hypothetical protein [Enterobacteriaceae bacterium RIT691]